MSLLFCLEYQKEFKLMLDHAQAGSFKEYERNLNLKNSSGSAIPVLDYFSFFCVAVLLLSGFDACFRVTASPCAAISMGNQMPIR